MPQLSTPWQWQFPPIAEPEDLPHQILHIKAELLEAAEACGAKNIQHTAEELMDVIHAAETALRLLEAEGMDLDAIKRGVIEKNQRRGYYGGDE